MLALTSNLGAEGHRCVDIAATYVASLLALLHQRLHKSLNPSACLVFVTGLDLLRPAGGAPSPRHTVAAASADTADAPTRQTLRVQYHAE